MNTMNTSCCIGNAEGSTPESHPSLCILLLWSTPGTHPSQQSGTQWLIDSTKFNVECCIFSNAPRSCMWCTFIYALCKPGLRHVHFGRVEALSDVINCTFSQMPRYATVLCMLQFPLDLANPALASYGISLYL